MNVYEDANASFVQRYWYTTRLCTVNNVYDCAPVQTSPNKFVSVFVGSFVISLVVLVVDCTNNIGLVLLFDCLFDTLCMPSHCFQISFLCCCICSAIHCSFVNQTSRKKWTEINLIFVGQVAGLLVRLLLLLSDLTSVVVSHVVSARRVRTKASFVDFLSWQISGSGPPKLA